MLLHEIKYHDYMFFNEKEIQKLNKDIKTRGIKTPFLLP